MITNTQVHHSYVLCFNYCNAIVRQSKKNVSTTSRPADDASFGNADALLLLDHTQRHTVCSMSSLSLTGSVNPIIRYNMVDLRALKS